MGGENHGGDAPAKAGPERLESAISVAIKAEEIFSRGVIVVAPIWRLSGGGVHRCLAGHGVVVEGHLERGAVAAAAWGKDTKPSELDPAAATVKSPPCEIEELLAPLLILS